VAQSVIALPPVASMSQAWEGSGSMELAPSSSSQNQVGFTGLVRFMVTVVADGALMLATSSGMPTPGVYGAQLATLSLSAAFVR
jgi:hypothetical protein